ncbi:MAG: peptidoglycan editing factor PgeF [Patescibacteria group bacterium]
MLNFDSNNDLILGISDRSCGNLRVFSAPENRAKFFSSFNKRIIAADLVHGDQVVIVDNNSDDIVSGDALITNNPNIILSITVADCLPVYFYDRVRKVIGLAHAGWHGVEDEIAVKVVKLLQDKYGSLNSDIAIFIGPHIGACHFEVQSDLIQKFSSYPEFIISQSGKTFIDLAGIVSKQLMAIGLSDISVSSECTYCLPDKYFSFRRDKPKDLEVMAAYIGLK